MIIAHKIELDLTVRQKEYINQLFGYNRYIFNKALDVATQMFKNWKEDKESGNKPKDCRKYPSSMYLRPAVRSLPKEDWEDQMSKQVFDTACDHVASAFGRFKLKHLDSKRRKFPKYKTRKRSKDSIEFYRKCPSTFRIEDGKLSIYTLNSKIGLLRLKEQVRFPINDNIKRVFISRRADRYFASLVIELEKSPFKRLSTHNNKSCGIDVGVTKPYVAASSDGDFYEVDGYSKIKKELNRLDRKIAFYGKSLSRKNLARTKSKSEKDSNNFKNVKLKLQRVYLRKDCIVQNMIHETTSFICKNFRYICIEDLAVSNLLKNHRLSKSIFWSNFYEFRRQLEYKSLLYGNYLICVDKFYPSTQKCSGCGNVLQKEDKLPLSKKIYKCPECGLKIHRDYNAALNLLQYCQQTFNTTKRV